MSRRFKTATQAGLDELMSRDLSELRRCVLMLDGVHFAEQCCVVALAILADGTKVPVGLWLGDTENKTVVTALLADLVDRGLSADGGLLVVIDGAKALATAVRKVFGDTALIQRCTLHKRRNVRDHLPKDQQAWVDRKLAAAFTNTDPAAGERACRELATQLEDRWPDAAASLRERLTEMFTVRRLGVTGRLERYEATGDTRRAVSDGIARTGRPITNAALVMIVVFIAFGVTGPIPPTELGITLALAVLLDATIVRVLLVPATMALIGDRNWYLPRWLDRVLPHVHFSH